MSTREELEAALRSRPDDATLLVYADYLQGQGDPRGELIALDMRPPGMSMQSLENRRGQLLDQWLGDDLDLHFDAEQQLWLCGELGSTYATFDCGFIDLHVSDDYNDVVAKLLDTPAGAYVRRLSVGGPTAMLEPLIERVAAKPRTWLQHLSIERAAHETPILIDAALGRALTAATPHLEILDLLGRRLFEEWTHPNLRELGVTGFGAISLQSGPPLPSLYSIDFAYDDDDTPRRVFFPERLPALRKLDFSRTEPGAESVFRKLPKMYVAKQLSRLVLPSIRTQTDLGSVQVAISQMPMLRELTIAREYACFPRFANELVHQWARINIPTPWPWPPRDMLELRALSIDGYATDLAVFVEALESQYDELDEDMRALWYRFWHAIDAIEADHEQAFNAADLARALDGIERPEPLSDLLRHLRARLAHRGEFFVALRWD